MSERVKFQFPDSDLSLVHPSTWIHKCSDGKTHVFTNTNVGAFRITPTVVPKEEFDLKQFLKRNLKASEEKGQSPQMKTYNGNLFIHTRQTLTYDKGTATALFYVSACANIAFTCSYVFDDKIIHDEFWKLMHETSLKDLDLILGSIKA